MTQTNKIGEVNNLLRACRWCDDDLRNENNMFKRREVRRRFERYKKRLAELGVEYESHNLDTKNNPEHKL